MVTQRVVGFGPCSRALQGICHGPSLERHFADSFVAAIIMGKTRGNGKHGVTNGPSVDGKGCFPHTPPPKATSNVCMSRRKCNSPIPCLPLDRHLPNALLPGTFFRTRCSTYLGNLKSPSVLLNPKPRIVVHTRGSSSNQGRSACSYVPASPGRSRP